MRAVDRILGAVLALALIVVGVVAAVEILVAGLGGSSWIVPHERWAESARTTRWSDADLRLAFAGLIAAGILLLVLQAVRRRPEALPLAAGGPDVASEVDRRGLEQWLAEQAEGVEGVAHARARVRARAAVVEAASVGRDTAPVEEGVRQVSASSLESLGLERMPRLRVKVRSSKERTDG